MGTTSSEGGRLGCFCTLAVSRNASVNIRWIYLFQLLFLFSLDKYPEVELLDHVAGLFFIFFLSFLNVCLIVAFPRLQDRCIGLQL